MNRIIALGFAGVFCLAMLLPGAAQAADMALVIGNSKYREGPSIPTARADARAVARALADAGYDVSLGLDLKRKEMRRKLREFGERLKGAERVVIYYVGHAIRSGSQTYLAPVDQDDDNPVEMVMDAVPLEVLLELANERQGRTVIFLDAAHSRGIQRRRFVSPGLGKIDPRDRAMVVSAAPPGRTIADRGREQSRFSREVIRQFLSPGARAMRAARDMRSPAWFTGSVRSNLRLVTRGGGGGSIGRGDTPADVEAALRLGRAQRREIQESLSLLGHDPRGIDGQFGPGSRTAIRLWQRANNLPETGYLTGEQTALLHEQSAEAGRGDHRSRDSDYWARTGVRGTGDGYRRYLERYSDGLYADEARTALKRMARTGSDADARREREVWRDAEYSDRPRDYRDYLQRYPTGIWLPEAEQRLAGLAAPAPEDPAVAESALRLTRNDRVSVEQRLDYLGFPPGAQDGRFDASTRRAIKDYQRNRRHKVTGYLDQPTYGAIMNETRDARSNIIIDGTAVLRGLLGTGTN